MTKRGKELATAPGALFGQLIPFYVLEVDHASYGRFDEHPFGKWDVWINVINVEIENGASERALFGQFYGVGPDWDNAAWREMAAFSHCVLKPLEWSGLISVHDANDGKRSEHICFKTPLWRSALQLDTDHLLERASLH